MKSLILIFMMLFGGALLFPLLATDFKDIQNRLEEARKELADLSLQARKAKRREIQSLANHALDSVVQIDPGASLSLALDAVSLLETLARLDPLFSDSRFGVFGDSRFQGVFFMHSFPIYSPYDKLFLSYENLVQSFEASLIPQERSINLARLQDSRALYQAWARLLEFLMEQMASERQAYPPAVSADERQLFDRIIRFREQLRNQILESLKSQGLSLGECFTWLSQL